MATERKEEEAGGSHPERVKGDMVLLAETYRALSTVHLHQVRERTLRLLLLLFAICYVLGLLLLFFAFLSSRLECEAVNVLSLTAATWGPLAGTAVGFFYRSRNEALEEGPES